jgi:hypothetical protein
MKLVYWRVFSGRNCWKRSRNKAFVKYRFNDETITILAMRHQKEVGHQFCCNEYCLVASAIQAHR